MEDRGFGEDPRPAGVAPEQDDIPLGGQARFELGPQLFTHVIHLVQVAERHRHDLQGQGRQVNLREPLGRQEAGIEVAGLHQAHHVGFGALGAAGEDDELDGAV